MSEAEAKDISQYLFDNYYSKYKGKRTDVVPTPAQAMMAVMNADRDDKIVVVRDDKIRGVAVFVTLSDETYAKVRHLDITAVDILTDLFKESGPNIHFVLLCADGWKTILYGIDKVKAKYDPKTISWWNPDLSQFHEYKFKER